MYERHGAYEIWAWGDKNGECGVWKYPGAQDEVPPLILLPTIEAARIWVSKQPQPALADAADDADLFLQSLAQRDADVVALQAENARLQAALKIFNEVGLYRDWNHVADILDQAPLAGWESRYVAAIGFAIGTFRRIAELQAQQNAPTAPDLLATLAATVAADAETVGVDTLEHAQALIRQMDKEHATLQAQVTRLQAAHKDTQSKYLELAALITYWTSVTDNWAHVVDSRGEVAKAAKDALADEQQRAAQATGAEGAE